MSGIISGRDIIEALQDLMDDGVDVGFDDDYDIIGLPRTRMRRERRSNRREGRANRREGRRNDRFGDVAPQLEARDNALSTGNHGMPVTYGTSLIPSEQRGEPFGMGEATVTGPGQFWQLSQVAQKPMQALALVMDCTIVTDDTPAVLIYGQDALAFLRITRIFFGTGYQPGGFGLIGAQFYGQNSFHAAQVFTPVQGGSTVLIEGVTAATVPAAASVSIGGTFKVVAAHSG